MRMDIFFYGILLFSLFMVAGTFIYTGVVDTHGLNVSAEDVGFSEVYDKSEGLFDDGSNVKDDILYADVEGSDQTEDSLIKGAFKATKTASSSVGLVAEIMTAVTNKLGIPPFFQAFLTIAIMIGVTFGVIYLVRGILA